MSDANDMDLVREYGRCNSETAFNELAHRHVNMVYSVALRYVRQSQDAEDVTQAVFIILARKAAGMSEKTILTGWLYETTRLTAMKFIRTNRRRLNHEQEAFMQSLSDESDTDGVWRQMAPILEDAMTRLGEKDRLLLALRFFENKSGAEAAALAGVGEWAARKRTERALERLRKFFGRRGVVSTTATIAGAISANSVQAAPAGLAKTVTAVAIAKGSAATVSVAALVKGTMNTMTWLKLKLAGGVGLTALIAGGIVSVAISQTHRGNGQPSVEAVIKHAQKAYAALSSYNDDGEIIQKSGGYTFDTTFDIRLQRPNLYHIDWTQATEYFTNGGVAWSAGGLNYLQIRPWQNPQSYRDMRPLLESAAGVSGGASSTIPAVFFNQNLNKNDVLRANHPKLGPDDVLEGVSCYVVSSTIEETGRRGSTPQKTTTTVWIGKRDYLIRQVQEVFQNPSVTIPKLSDAVISRILQQGGVAPTSAAIAAKRAELQEINDRVTQNTKESGFVFMETHRNIVVNRKYAAGNFSD